MLKPSPVSSMVITAAFLVSSPTMARTVSIPFSASNFTNSTTINNSYFPLVPGTTYTYKADIPDGCEVDVMRVTYDTRVMDGVTTVVVDDRVYDAAVCRTGPANLVERTLDYYAQDNAGNVWYMGEDTFDCQGANNCTVGDGAWIGGVNGAQPGIIMLANPRKGDTYRQEYLPGVAEDQATVDGLGVTATPTRDDAYRSSYSNCLVTKEFTDLEKGARGSKTYCPGIGVVIDTDHHGKAIRSELVSISGTANALRFRRPRRP